MNSSCGAKRFLKLFLLVGFFIVPHVCATDYNIADIFDRLCLDADIVQPDIDNIKIVKAKASSIKGKKDWTIILYISADNDLAPFAIRNIKQMAKIGSNQHFNIVVQLDIRKSNGQKITRRYYIEKGKVLHLNDDDPDSQCMDSGDPETLVSFCGWSIENFPAKHYGLVLWNHGSGVLDPLRYRVIKPEELFIYNPETQRLELERSIGYLDRMLSRGICFDDSTGNYLTNQKLDYALDKICKTYLDGQKFNFIAFDACLMQMLEVANFAKKYAHIMIGSQEAGLCYGWNYSDVLEPFNNGTFSPVLFANHIVKTYENTYHKITNDHTMSAINLDLVEYLEENLNDLACLLLEGLKLQKDGMVKKTIRASRSRIVCTHFDEPSYIDLHHFYSNLLANLGYIQLRDSKKEKTFKNELKKQLQDGLKLIESVVFAHSEGKSLSLAHGISIYFPENRIHLSYRYTPFAQDNQWINFLVKYLVS